ncbi:MAG: hypothetical protein ABJM06_06435 [Gilvibacter sp.]
MKKFILLPVLIVLCTLLIACDNDKDDDPINKIEGAFSLLSYDCCLLTQEDYVVGEIIYDFDGANMVTVWFTISPTPESQLPIQTAGVYEYTEIDNRLVLNGIEYEFTLIGDQLTLFDDPELDGAIITFKEFQLEDE